MKKGIFITVEGPEGAGKTTVLSMLAEELKASGHNVIVTREPGGIPIAEQIRGVILHQENVAMDPRTEALLYAAARRQHLVEKVQPHLKAGFIILCDRFIDSSLAYQGYARGLGMDEVFSINQFAINGFMPELTLYFDLDPAMGLTRINRNNEREKNRLDLEDIHFHDKVREGYLLLANKYHDRIVTIDASLPLQDVFEQARRKVLEIVGKES